MRGMLVLVVVGGCGFEHGIPANVLGDDAPDDAVLPLDAALAPDAAIDAMCGDEDLDGTCNDVDDWPCGVKPAAPGATMMMSGNGGQTAIEISTIALDGTGRLAVATPNEMLALGFHYEIDDTACPQACVDQIEVGWVPGRRDSCPFDDTVPAQNGAQGNINMQIRAPMMPGMYDLRANIGQNLSCTHDGANNWWNATPAASRTIAKLCVH